MKIKLVCWGTGKIANAFMNSFEKRYGSCFEIVCFSDNDETKYGKTFFGKPVIPFDKSLGFDYVLVLTSYYRDIKNQLIKLDIPVENILRVDDLINVFITKYWSNKRVLFYGDRYSFEYIEFLAKYTFKDVDFCEHGTVLPDTGNIDFVLLCPPRLVSPEEASKYENDLLQKIGKCKYIRRDDYMWFLDSNRSLSFGERNPDKTFFIVHGQDPKSGWANILLRIADGIYYAKKNNMIPIIDMQNIRNQYLPEMMLGKKNVWNDYFKPINSCLLEDVYRSKNVIIERNCCSGNYQELKYISLNKRMQDIVENEYHSLFPDGKKVLGVVYRGTDYYRAYNHPHPIDLEKILVLVKEKMHDAGCEFIFLATEIEEVTCFFKNYFGQNVFFTNQKRYSINERRFLADVHFDRPDDEYKKGEEFIIVLELLSRCNSLLGLNTATTICAEALRGFEYEKRYFI